MPKRKRTDLIGEKRKRPYTLVSKNPFSTTYPAFFGSHAENFSSHASEWTKTDSQKNTQKQMQLDTTPSGQHLKINNNNVCGHTPGGTELICTPSRKVHIVTITPQGKNSDESNLYLLIRKTDYMPGEPTSVMSTLFSEGEIKKQSSLSVTATATTRASQPSRHTQRSQRAAVGCSALDIAEKFFAASSSKFSRHELEQERWNLCHLLSYGIAKNATSTDGTVFDPQIKENLYAGSRVLNENMMRVENVLLQILQENNSLIDAIEYSAFPFVFKHSHILAGITLKAKLLTTDQRTIWFEYQFDVKDNRRYSDEMSTALLTALHAIIDQKTSSAQENDSCVKKLF